MRALRMAGGLTALLGATAAAPGPVQDVAALGWMSGTWAVQNGEEWTEERWSPPRGGLMVGNSMTGKGDKASGFEYFRITKDEKGDINYLTQPGGQPVVAFKLTSASQGEVLFENPAHDFPTRIAYRRNGDEMVATISGPNGSNPISWTYKRKD